MDNSATSWIRTVAEIGSFDMPPASWQAPRRRTVTRDRLPPWDPASRPTISVLERPTPDTAMISWRDACTGHYGYQKWRLFTTRRRGVCALSGQPIEIGDSVYAPQLLGSTPGNAAAMVLATCLDAARTAEAA
ncbi:DUF3331 domain-containing protein [Burkholderia multivorans]|jgi:hypothetical protein|uniref:DUF3331 domain-containing protein n=2 Tax=Burkholderia multivorans TaxID=87883 RepID=A0A0H3KMY9_BURM1|nr:DUF3331 domain-containing protein [Burkholderia multivorans]ABX17607.1 conserved hypothetical protein [Burkholderia multivorans ATCC 17616]AIO73097.1 hypothetical protein DM80_5245 [Burkholderia multivorans]AJY16724.1 hypothetical protein NP80_4678 [Burkholderia multivorans ATCC BAA-247]AOK65329.1 hypothetical protein WM33_07105 [Burkholderia multivorans]AVR18891.1 DUF3331 domain-containing protein [Burkholderia multivorans]